MTKFIACICTRHWKNVVCGHVAVLSVVCQLHRGLVLSTGIGFASQFAVLLQQCRCTWEDLCIAQLSRQFHRSPPVLSPVTSLHHWSISLSGGTTVPHFCCPVSWDVHLLNVTSGAIRREGRVPGVRRRRCCAPRLSTAPSRRTTRTRPLPPTPTGESRWRAVLLRLPIQLQGDRTARKSCGDDMAELLPAEVPGPYLPKTCGALLRLALDAG